MRHTYLTWYMSLSKQYGSNGLHKICFKGDNYITKKVRVISLARDTPIDPPINPYLILSNYLKQYGGYDLHNISTSGEVTT